MVPNQSFPFKSVLPSLILFDFISFSILIDLIFLLFFKFTILNSPLSPKIKLSLFMCARKPISLSNFIIFFLLFFVFNIKIFFF